MAQLTVKKCVLVTNTQKSTWSPLFLSDNNHINLLSDYERYCEQYPSCVPYAKRRIEGTARVLRRIDDKFSKRAWKAEKTAKKAEMLADDFEEELCSSLNMLNKLDMLDTLTPRIKAREKRYKIA